MAVMFNRDRTEIVVTCKCGCEDSIHIKMDVEDPDCYMMATYMNGNFYTDQDATIFRTIGKKLKKIWAIIRNKDYYYSEICMSEEDFEEFREFIGSF